MDYLEFVSQYRDGSTICTINSAGPNVFPMAPHDTTVSASWLADYDTLYRAHRCVTGWKSPGKTKTLRLDDVHQGDIVACITEEMREPLEDALSIGYLRYSEDNGQDEAWRDDDNPYGSPGRAYAGHGRYTPTIKGAYLMTWKLLWPVKPLYKQFVVWHGKRTLAQAGFVAAQGGARAVG